MNDFADYIENVCQDTGLAVHCVGATRTPRFVSYELRGASLAELREVSHLAPFRLRQRGSVVFCEVKR